MTDEAFWVISTFAFIGTTIIMGLITLSFWFFMKEEGRFFFKRAFGNKGIDVIRHEPQSNRLRLIVVKWNGQFFQFGKEMMFFGIEKIINPMTEPQKYFNEVVSRMCTWAGSKRPVLFATDIMSHIITPDHLALVAKAKKHKEYTEAQEMVPTIKTRLEAALRKEDECVDPELVTYLETMKPDDLTEFMEDISGRDAWNAYLTGKRVNELERAKGIELGGAAKIALGLAGVGVVVLIIYLAATGKLETIINMVAK